MDFDERMLFEGNFEEASGRQGMDSLLRSGLAFTGLVCANDEMAAGAMDRAREHGLHIPDDISIIGFDNVFFSRYLNPKLSSIGCQIDEMGRMAARCVLKTVYGARNIHIQNQFKPSLELRASVKSRQTA
jgi:LacI family transcriptional regulator